MFSLFTKVAWRASRKGLKMNSFFSRDILSMNLLSNWKCSMLNIYIEIKRLKCPMNLSILYPVTLTFRAWERLHSQLKQYLMIWGKGELFVKTLQWKHFLQIFLVPRTFKYDCTGYSSLSISTPICMHSVKIKVRPKNKKNPKKKDWWRPVRT